MPVRGSRGGALVGAVLLVVPSVVAAAAADDAALIRRPAIEAALPEVARRFERWRVMFDFGDGNIAEWPARRACFLEERFPPRAPSLPPTRPSTERQAMIPRARLAIYQLSGERTVLPIGTISRIAPWMCGYTRRGAAAKPADRMVFFADPAQPVLVDTGAGARRLTVRDFRNRPPRDEEAQQRDGTRVPLPAALTDRLLEPEMRQALRLTGRLETGSRFDFFAIERPHDDLEQFVSQDLEITLDPRRGRERIRSLYWYFDRLIPEASAYWAQVWGLFREQDGHWRPLHVWSSAYAGLRSHEHVVVLAAVDLDGDGIDELIVERRLYEGRTWLIVGWEHDRPVVLYESGYDGP
jgi:hypothetical protein